MSVPTKPKATKGAGSRSKPAPVSKPLPAPGPRELEAISKAEERVKARSRRVSMRLDIEGGKAKYGPSHNDPGYQWRTLDAFGTASPDFVETEILRLAKALAPSNQSSATEATLNAALAVIDGIKPENEVEAMLASQMAMTHVLAMQAMSRAHWADMIPEYQAAGNFAIKLARTFTMQMEALQKLRRGGEQTVRVEHVHVHPGGQAIVGNVTHPGGGGTQGNGDQPHATSREIISGPETLAFAPGAAVWSEDTVREPVPVA